MRTFDKSPDGWLRSLRMQRGKSSSLALGALVLLGTAEPRAGERKQGDGPTRTTCFFTAYPVASIDEQAILTTEGAGYASSGRLLWRLPLAEDANIGAVRYDRGATFVAGYPSHEGAECFTLESFGPSTVRRWSRIPEPFFPIDEDIGSVIDIGLRPPTGDVLLLLGQSYCEGSTPCWDEQRTLHRPLVRKTELRAFDRNGTPLGNVALPSFPISFVAFSNAGSFAVAGATEQPSKLELGLGKGQRTIEKGIHFISLFNNQGKLMWGSALLGAAAAPVGVKFDQEGRLWLAVAPCGRKVVGRISVLSGSGTTSLKAGRSRCIHLLRFSKRGSVERDVPVCVGADETRSLCPDINGYVKAFLGGADGQIALATNLRLQAATSEVIDLRNVQDRSANAFTLLPVAGRPGPAVIAPGPISVAGTSAGRYCVALPFADVRKLRCDSAPTPASQVGTSGPVVCIEPGR